MESSNRVIVVGAGPVGLVAALRLGRAGIPTLVLEAEPDIVEELRASTFHPPTLDMLDELGLAAPLIAQGLVTPTWQIRLHETHERAVFDLSLLRGDTAHPYRLQCEQHKLSRLLLAALAKAPAVELRFGVRVAGVDQDDTGVRVHATAGDEAATFAARFVVGADGARSAVRKSLGLSFEGRTYPETTILATTTFEFADHLPGLSNVNYVWATGGTFSLLRVPGRWRASLYPAAGETVEAALAPASIERKLQAIVPRPVPYEVLECRPYRVHQRVVDDYRVGRVALAGDAAHLNSPAGGMGMNGGIHDAFNLADKLAEIWAGGDLSLLDAYTRQRRPVAVDEILAQADRNRARMRETDGARRRAMLAELQAITTDPVKARAYLLKSSMIEGLRRAASTS